VMLFLFVSLTAFAQVPVPPVSGDGVADVPDADRPYSTLRYNSISGSGFEGSSYFSSKIGLSYLYDSYLGDSAASPTGTFTLVHRARKNDTEITYSAGGSIHSEQSQYDTQYHRLAVSETFHGALWRVTLADQFAYLPNSAYGSSAFGGISPQLIQILEQLLPNQSFLQPGGQQYMNAVMVNADRSFSRRFSVHGGFNYSLLQYLDSGLIGLQAYQGSGGLSRMIGRRDSIAVDYTGGLTDFTGSSSMVSNKLSVSYTHPFRNKAKLILTAGPEAVLLRNPGQTDIKKTVVDGSASFTWQTRGTDASLTYSHGAGSGGGLLQGAEVDSAVVSVSRRLGRVWTVSQHDGFNNVSQLSSLLSTATPTSYRTIYAGFSVNRNIGRTFTFNLNYDFQYQIENQRVLSVPAYRRNLVMAGLTYNLRPISLR